MSLDQRAAAGDTAGVTLHRSLIVLLTLAACGDNGSNGSASASGTEGSASTGNAASTGVAASTGTEVPTTGAGSQSASDSQATTGTTATSGGPGGTGGTGETGDTSDTTATSTTSDTTGSLSATEGTTQATGADSSTGTDSSTGEACVDECVDGEPQCVGDGAVQVCGVGDLGCLEWGEPDPCAPDEVCEAGACVVGCVDACAPGSKQCVDAGVSSCIDDPMTGCSVWSDPVACAAGKVCDAGVCVTPAVQCLDDCVWTKQVINASVDFYSVWGSGAKAVWTVGASGTALYYNGVTWKAVDSGVGTRLECVHGSAADDVYAITRDAQIIRWDGTEWLPHVDLNPTWGESACISVIAPKDLLAIVYDSNGSKVHLYRVTNGVKSLLDTVSPQDVYTPDGSKIASMSLHAFSATSAYGTADRAYRWNGVDLVNMVSPNPSFGLWALEPNFAYAAAPHSGIGHRWDGQTWKIVNPGLNGYVHMFTGTAKTRVFAVGETQVGAIAAIVAFDGIGWSPMTTPADAKALFAGWSAATGEVFAVGKGGTILIGK